MSLPTAVPPPVAPGGFQSKGGNWAQRQAKERKYGSPLPVLLPTSPLHPSSRQSKPPGAASVGVLATSPSRAIEVPSVVGIFDAATQSVWVADGQHMAILFNRGFFGKGSLSRSEPGWRQRRVDILRGGNTLAAEQVREKRRLERKQFKIDRAAAMLDAAKKAEAVLTTGQLPEDFEADAEGATETGQADEAGASSPTLPPPSVSSSLPAGTNLNAQTFLVRPARPDSNRNRGKKPFKRRPPPPPGQARPPPPPPPPPADPSSDEASEDEASLAVKDMEHLQLSLEEAWFLSAGLGVLKVLDPSTDTFTPSTALLSLFLTPPSPEQSLASPAALYPDDPLLVSYAAYHHYRSLGWCVRSGIKFCVDWLLYRRGPVFSHSVFSILMVPVYMDDKDRAVSPYGNTEWFQDRMSWKWINTVMRVNSLVQKTVIIAYITIPSLDAFPASARLPDGGLDPRKFNMQSLMAHYSVREVSLMRFSPARRRD